MYARKIEDRTYTFGVSGLLYRSNVLMYDHQTESLWLQVKRSAVTGPMTDTSLVTLPSTVTSWGKWIRKHPDTVVLGLETGHSRDYSRDPYADYYQSSRGMFSRFFRSGEGAGEKELVAGVVVNDDARAYPLSTLRKAGTIDDTLGGIGITLTFHRETDRVSLQLADGVRLEPMIVYWFVWQGIHAGTDLYSKERP